MTAAPACWMCETTEGLRKRHDGFWTVPPEYTCDECFTPTDDGPGFDDLPLVEAKMMTDPEIRQMIEVLGDTLPPDVANGSEQSIADYLRLPCDLCGYQLSQMDKHLPEIIARARANAGRLPERAF